MRSDGITVLIRMQLLPQSIEQGKQDLLELAREVRRNEPDCLAIELGDGQFVEPSTEGTWGKHIAIDSVDVVDLYGFDTELLDGRRQGWLVAVGDDDLGSGLDQ